VTQPGSAAVETGSRAAAERLLDHAQIIVSIARREVQSRFGHVALGYAWTYLVPLVWVAATYFAFYFFGRSSPVYTDILTFIISGIIPYAAFRYVINAVSRAPATMRGLLIFPSVRIEHGVAAMALIEFFNIFIVFAVVAAVNYLVFGNGELDDPLMFVEGVSLAWGLGLSYAYLFVVLAQFNPTFRNISQVLLRPTFFISGIFFTANELPDRVLSLLALNPVLHAVEISRDGMLFHYQSRVASPLYALLWIAIMLSAALIMRAFQDRE
jgi:capsular polysaccharide transport system permease protein